MWTHVYVWVYILVGGGYIGILVKGSIAMTIYHSQKSIWGEKVLFLLIVCNL